MRIQVISPTAVESGSGGAGEFAGLAGGGEALLNSGFLETIEAGRPEILPNPPREIAGIARPALPAEQATDDPIVNVGRFNRLIADAIVAGAEDDAVPLLVGGTCRHLIGMIAGLQRVYGATARIGLVWFDAHGDFNTPRTTRSGMLGGMPVAACAGLCHATWREEAGQTAPLPTDRILMVDVRNLDPEEETLIAATDVRIARFGPDGKTDAIGEAVRALADRVDHLYVHVDADVLDASLQPNHPTVEPGGPDVEAVSRAVDNAMHTHKVRAFGVVSVNPDGPHGPTSLASAKAIILHGVGAWDGPHL